MFEERIEPWRALDLVKRFLTSTNGAFSDPKAGQRIGSRKEYQDSSSASAPRSSIVNLGGLVAICWFSYFG